MTTATVPLAARMTDKELKQFTSGKWGRAKTRVARGAKFLDRTKPGWRDQVVVNSLELASPCKCVLGQIFADQVSGGGRWPRDSGFGWALAHMFERMVHGVTPDAIDAAIFFGFDYDEPGGVTYTNLQEAWEAVLA